MSLAERTLARAIVAFAIYLLSVPALLFVAAGTAKWPMAWVYVGLLLAATLGSRLVVWKTNPDTLRERAQFTSAEGTKSWDRLLVLVVGLLGPMVLAIVAGLDHRYGWSRAIPVYGQVLGALAIAVGYGLAVWAMIANAYFSAVARIQDDRGQTVVTTGPYRLVRHPSYAGALLALVGLPVMLSALWAFVPGVLYAAAVIVRTAFEDRMLLDELDGYRDYAARTRYRLVPGVW